MNKLYRNILILIFILILVCYFLLTKTKENFDVQGISTSNLDKLYTLTSDNRADIAREILQSNELSDMLNPEFETIRGARGPQGISIDSARLNSEGNLILNMNDGTERKIHGVKGEQGEVKTVHGNVIRGPQGSPAPLVTKIDVKKINEGNDDEKNVLQFEYDDGRVFNTQTNIKGFKGEPCRGTSLAQSSGNKGNVGIGLSSGFDAQSKLHVNGHFILEDGNKNSVINTGGNFYFRKLGADYAQNGQGGSQDLMIVKNDGNVGIGTSNPKYKLDVNGDIRLPQKYAADGEGNKLLFHSDGDAGFGEAGINYVGGPLYDEQQGSYLNFFTGNSSNTGNSSKMVIKKNGNVGIGTTSPNDKLDVSLTSDDGPGGIKISRKGGQLNSLPPTITIKNTQTQNNSDDLDGFKMQSKLKFEGPIYTTAEIRGIDSRMSSANSSANQDVFRGDLEFWTKLHTQDGEGRDGLQKRMTINSEGNVIVEGGNLCIDDICINKAQLQKLRDI